MENLELAKLIVRITRARLILEARVQCPGCAAEAAIAAALKELQI